MSDKKADVLVWGPVHAALTQNLNRDFTVHNRWEIADIDAWAAEHGDKIRGVVTSGVYGTDNSLLDKLPNLKLSNTPDVLNNAVAETAMALMLCVSRRISEAERFVRAGKWLTGKLPLGNDLCGKTCGIVGLGKIGKTIAKRAAAFDMNIAYYRRGQAYSDVSYTHYGDLIELAKASDYLIVIVPGGADTQHLINADVLKALGPKGYLINVARGSVVDEQALVASLLESGIAGAGLDVFEDEPQVPAELLTLDNVVLTPHIGSGTYETRQAMADLVFANVSRFFDEGELVTPVAL